MKLFLTLFLIRASAWAMCPDDMVEFSQYCIDKYEAPNQEGQRPFVGKTAVEGVLWCASLGKRLCTEDEWLLACEGAARRAHPYGDVWKPKTCNDEKVWRPVNWGRVNRFPEPAGQEEIAKLNQAGPSGSFPRCATPEGVFDLGGNVSEWVIKTHRYTTNYNHVMMGCYWSGCYEEHRGKDRSICRGTNAGHPGDHRFRTYEAGFRCCLDSI